MQEWNKNNRRKINVFNFNIKSWVIRDWKRRCLFPFCNQSHAIQHVISIIRLILRFCSNHRFEDIADFTMNLFEHQCQSMVNRLASKYLSLFQKNYVFIWWHVVDTHLTRSSFGIWWNDWRNIGIAYTFSTKHLLS